MNVAVKEGLLIEAFLHDKEPGQDRAFNFLALLIISKHAFEIT